ncbi:hypothetical protein AB0D57_43120 [Streptomyces sp. NPDC048275]|uniref:hypothetical protein n=1 Tax=Streptomyces sp. NPDC048275 TaxID=3155629 RepID=UPI0033CB312E
MLGDAVHRHGLEGEPVASDELDPVRADVLPAERAGRTPLEFRATARGRAG